MPPIELCANSIKIMVAKYFILHLGYQLEHNFFALQITASVIFGNSQPPVLLYVSKDLTHSSGSFLLYSITSTTKPLFNNSGIDLFVEVTPASSLSRIITR